MRSCMKGNVTQSQYDMVGTKMYTLLLLVTVLINVYHYLNVGPEAL
jgi:hypothetical protein